MSLPFLPAHLVVSAVARSCAQQPIERPAVRLTVAIKRKAPLHAFDILAMRAQFSIASGTRPATPDYLSGLPCSS